MKVDIDKDIFCRCIQEKFQIGTMMPFQINQNIIFVGTLLKMNLFANVSETKIIQYYQWDTIITEDYLGGFLIVCFNIKKCIRDLGRNSETSNPE